MSTLIHEFSHSIDWHALTQYGSPFSGTSNWIDNYNQDSASPTGYARTNWMEDFAETGMVAVYDRVSGGKFGDIEPSWNSIC